MGPDSPHPGVPCPVEAPLWEELCACLGLQNWTVVPGLPIPAMRLFPKTPCPAQCHPKKSTANTPCFGGRMAETRQTWAHPAARQDSRRAELWVSYMSSWTSGQLRAAKDKAGRLLGLEVHLGWKNTFKIIEFNARLFLPGARQSEWRHCSWEKAHTLIDFIY